MSTFRFKQFTVDQTGCAMKVNTDAVLLATLTEIENPLKILDVGTGTGVISLMLAQLNPGAHIDAVDIDEAAAEAAKRNFEQSPFSERLLSYPLSFQNYFDLYPDQKFDLIISNPPFFLNSLKSAAVNKQLARHTDEQFFTDLLSLAQQHLRPTGVLALILPLEAARLVLRESRKLGLSVKKEISIHSFPESAAHRTILMLQASSSKPKAQKFVIYSNRGEYSEEYKCLLKDFLTIF